MMFSTTGKNKCLQSKIHILLHMFNFYTYFESPAIINVHFFVQITIQATEQLNSKYKSLRKKPKKYYSNGLQHFDYIVLFFFVFFPTTPYPPFWRQTAESL
jgi:hypothetical protein